MPRARRRTETPTITPDAYRQLVYRQMSEAVFQQHILVLAKQYGWRCHHARPARKAPKVVQEVDADGRVRVKVIQKWVTAISGHPGFPDLILAKAGVLGQPARVIIAELKTEVGAVSDEQDVWLQLLATCPGIFVCVWRPSDWPEIIDLLTNV